MTAADPLSTKTVIGEAEANSTMGQQRRDEHETALEAREKGDLEKLFAAYRGAVESRAQAEEMWIHGVSALMEKPELSQASAIGAIRDVALAAIQLAKKVALKEGARMTEETD